MSSTTDQNPYAIPMVSTFYTVVATDLNGRCTDTASIFISALCDTCDKPIPIVDGLTCYGGSDASISGVPDGIDGPPWIIQLMDASYVNTFAVDSNVTSSFLFDSLSAGNYVIRLKLSIDDQWWIFPVIFLCFSIVFTSFFEA